jgi:hypothetical protein
MAVVLGGDGKMTEIEVFQREIADKLTVLLVQQGYESEVKIQWSAFSGHGRRTYSPKVDIAVGPFAVERGYENEYDLMVNSFRRLVDTWIDMFRQNWQSVIGGRYWSVSPYSPSGYRDFIEQSANRNARCFIAIEVENKNSRKHLLGSIINAGALGRVGILVAWREEVLRAAIRIREYFDLLQEAEKRTFNMSDVIVLSRNQLAASLGRFST